MKKRLMRLRREKGSALLVSLMIMVGLSLLGLGFVAISETESAISVNERNYVQAQSAAETGTKAVVQMFQNAGWAQTQGLLPPNVTSFKALRCHGNPATSTTACTTGKDYYKGTAGTLLFDAPFKGSKENRFYGDIDSADIWIKDDAGGPGTTYLNKLSAALFYTPAGSLETLRISEIRVYAPPWPGAAKMYGSLTPTPAAAPTNGFYEGATPRYGVATIRVTAQKIVNTQVRAERSVKAIIAETPFPTVDGAIETSGSLVGQGNFNVYWGKLLSEKAMNVVRPAVGLPWLDAKNVAPFEFGYDTTQERKAAMTYQPGDLVNAPDTCIQGDPNLSKFAFRWKGGAPAATAAAASSPTCAQWQAAESLGASVSDNAVTWTAEESRPTRVNTLNPDPTAQFYENTNWFYQVVGRTFEDPWLHARARNTLTYGPNTITPCSDAVNPHPCDYTNVNQPVESRYSNFFQNQYSTDPSTYPERLEAVFPTMDYEFWKAIAQSSSGQPNTSIYYFSYAGNGTTNLFTGPNGQVKDIVAWLNAAPDASNGNKPYNGLGAGFYFFDTMNGKNPQFNKGGTLTPEILLNSGSIPDPKFQIRGYVYLNATSFGSKGIGSTAIDDVYPMPPEPYRDTGYRQVCDDTAGCAATGGGTIAYGNFMLEGGATTPPTLPTASFITIGVNNGQWDFQDVNHNGQFDVYVADVTKGGTVPLKRPDGSPLPVPTYLPVPWFDGCKPPDPTQTPPFVPSAAEGCSEPHEPYLNLTYPTLNVPDGKLIVEWYDPTGASAVNYRRPKTRTGPNTAITCTADISQYDCTSNAYDSQGVDAKGALVSLSGTHAATAWGAIYNEGGYDAAGNADYYGALLMRGQFNGNGTPSVWFDACLAVGCLETQLKMQRVMITSMNTD